MTISSLRGTNLRFKFVMLLKEYSVIWNWSRQMPQKSSPSSWWALFLPGAVFGSEDFLSLHHLFREDVNYLLMLCSTIYLLIIANALRTHQVFWWQLSFIFADVTIICLFVFLRQSDSFLLNSRVRYSLNVSYMYFAVNSLTLLLWKARLLQFLSWYIMY